MLAWVANLGFAASPVPTIISVSTLVGRVTATALMGQRAVTALMGNKAGSTLIGRVGEEDGS